MQLVMEQHRRFTCKQHDVYRIKKTGLLNTNSQLVFFEVNNYLIRIQNLLLSSVAAKATPLFKFISKPQRDFKTKPKPTNNNHVIIQNNEYIIILTHKPTFVNIFFANNKIVNFYHMLKKRGIVPLI